MNISFLISLIVIVLSGCVKLLPDTGPEPMRVDLKPAQVEPAPHSPHAESLKIHLPTCPEALDTARIAVSRLDNGITISEYLADIEWKDRLPILVQQRLMQLLNHSGLFKAVGLQTEKYNAAYLLQTHLHAFEIRKEGDQFNAHIEMLATFIRRYDHQVLHQTTFTVNIPLQDHSLNGFIKGLDEGFTRLQDTFLIWIADSLNHL